MRRIFAIVRVDFLQEFSSPLTLIFFLVLPLVFTASIAAGSGDGSSNDEPKDVRIALTVVQQDQGVLGEVLLEALRNNGLKPALAAELPENGLGLLVPADFTARLQTGSPVTLTLQADANEQNESLAAEQAVQAAQQQLWTALQLAQSGALELFDSQIARQDFVEALTVELVAAANKPVATLNVSWGDAPEQSGADDVTGSQQASAGQLVTWVQITLLGAGIVLVNERTQGTLSRLITCPTSRGLILGGKLLSRFLMGMLQISILLLSGWLLFDVAWGQSPAAVVIVAASFAFAATGLGLLIATIVKTPGQAGNLTIGLALVLAALGGAWWPLEVTPQAYQQVVQVLPTTWVMRAFTDILVHGASLGDVLLEILVLIGFGVGFFALGLGRFYKTRF